MSGGCDLIKLIYKNIFKYTSQNYWGFGLYPSSGFLIITRKKYKHDVSETGSVSVLR
jgi:hypothetical protein